MRPRMFFLCLLTAVSLLLAPSAKADIIDPHLIAATGGDAMPIGTGGRSVTLSDPGGTNQGGGIFVFQNVTGNSLIGVNVEIGLPDSFLSDVFNLTLVPPPDSGHQNVITTTQDELNSTCFASSSTEFCLHMSFTLDPGPFVLSGGNFVLDFNKPPFAEGSPDQQILDNTYTGGSLSDPTQIGEWPNADTAFVTPIPSVPEPRYAGLLGALVAVAIVVRRRG